jgi:homoserine kinase
MKMFKVIVPATTANMGPGYDALGMALQLHNVYQIEEDISGGVQIEDESGIPLEENLVYNVMKKVLDEYGHQLDNIKISTKTQIPISRGLGSSAACIVAGMMIANYFLDNTLSVQDMIQIGTEIEGHPDNIVPALVGGMAVSVYEGGSVISSKVNIPENLRFAVMIPDFSISTYEARKVIPQKYTRDECVFNIARVAMLAAVMNNGEIEKLRVAMKDKIHQPYRGQLIPEMDNIFYMAQNLGSKAEVISGSGSTLMAIIDKQNIKFEEAMKKGLKNLKGDWKIKVLEPDILGARYFL